MEQELMEEEYYEPMQIQTDEQTLSVYSYNGKNYVDGYVLSAAGLNGEIFQGRNNYYQVSDEQIDEICTRIGSSVSVRVEFHRMTDYQALLIANENYKGGVSSFGDDDLSQMFYESNDELSNQVVDNYQSFK